MNRLEQIDIALMTFEPERYLRPKLKSVDDVHLLRHYVRQCSRCLVPAFDGLIEGKSVWSLSPEFAEVFVGREAFEGLESSGEVVGPEEVCQVRFEWVVSMVKVAFYGGIFDGSVPTFDLTVGPWMVGFSQPMLDPIQNTEPVEGMTTEARGGLLPVLRQIGELDAVVGET